MPSDPAQFAPQVTADARAPAASHVLVIEDRDGAKRFLPFGADEIVLGRGVQGTTARLLERDVSRRHARFSRSNGTLWIEDLGSSNGTRVNGERLQGKRRIREGDLVQIGGYDIAVLEAAKLEKGVAALPVTPRGGEAAAPARAGEPCRLERPGGGGAPERRSRQARTLLLVGIVSLFLGWASGRLLRPGPQPATPAAAPAARR